MTGGQCPLFYEPNVNTCDGGVADIHSSVTKRRPAKKWYFW